MRFDDHMELNILSSHRVVPPYGMAGGSVGALGLNRVIRADGSIEVLPGVAGTELCPGDVLEVNTPGGGGFGEVVPPGGGRNSVDTPGRHGIRLENG